MRRMQTLLLALALALCSGAGAALPPESSAERIRAATLAWQDGDYPRALETLVEVLEADDGEAWVRRIALLTGEAWAVSQVAPDGRAVRIAPDGSRAAFRVGEGLDVTTRVVRLGGAGGALELQGTGFAFAPDGHRGVYLRLHVDEALRAAQARADELRAEGEISDWLAQLEEVRWLRARDSELRLVELETGVERALDVGDRVLAGSPVFDPAGDAVWAVSAVPDARDRSEILRIDLEAGVEVVAGGPGYRDRPRPAPGGRHLVYDRVPADPVPRPPSDDVGGGVETAAAVIVHELATGGERALAGEWAVVADSGDVVAFWSRGEDEARLRVLPLGRLADPITVFSTGDEVAELAVAPSGDALAFRRMPREDWELYVVRPSPGSDGTGSWEGDVETVRVTREIQHDLYPAFLDDGTLLGVVGEGRHRRSRVYDLESLRRARLFHNNTVRTIAPEYEWQASADGSRVLIVSERDGDTVSPERGVYLVDRRRPVTREELLDRLRRQLDAERSLRRRGREMFAPVADAVREAVDEVSMSRLYGYQEDLFGFDSKYVTEPGNARARDYLAATLASWGYEPELQWFEPEVRGRTVRTANVLVRLEGTANPELVYVLSSHFDSSSRGPGADDNSSGTAVLLETARVLARRPLPATVIFAAFTGEEAGLLGSREFVRRAEEDGLRVLGALNNDMLGWSNDQRLDNTIRYSNAGIRDLQHGAALGFSDLITYDALYYKSTDAAAYYEAWGDIVGGIGSYPVLGNPHYHRSHDVLETINHELVRETTRATVASVMLLASSPARLGDLEVVGEDGARLARWSPAPEADVVGYEVRLALPDGEVRDLGVTGEPRVELPATAGAGAVEVRAVTRSGLHGWDWARAALSEGG